MELKVGDILCDVSVFRDSNKPGEVPYTDIRRVRIVDFSPPYVAVAKDEAGGVEYAYGAIGAVRVDDENQHCRFSLLDEARAQTIDTHNVFGWCREADVDEFKKLLHLSWSRMRIDDALEILQAVSDLQGELLPTTTPLCLLSQTTFKRASEMEEAIRNKNGVPREL